MLVLAERRRGDLRTGDRRGGPGGGKAGAGAGGGVAGAGPPGAAGVPGGALPEVRALPRGVTIPGRTVTRVEIKPDRKAPCPCGSGRRYKSCCYARHRALENARGVARAGLGAIDEVLRVFLPLIESRGEHKIACHEGCNACCANFVRCSLPEALVVAEWLAEPEHAAVRSRFEAALPGWRAAAGADAAVIEDLLARHGGTPTEGPEWEDYSRIGLDYTRKRNLCPFNRDGRCEIYEVRPTICRAVHVVETEAYCTPDRGGVPKVASHPRLVEAVQQATAAFAHGARSLGTDGRERALPEAVATALALSGYSPG
ncbi:MAG: hypothetical protein EXR72_17600 [Myxococcales bacterium]|nr:hypothetical protein [Myxococcales bacterium]